jgi:predicted RNA binding protein YcfA (HicA-like mRNA interferase family)
MANFYRDLIAILKANNCTFVREGKGSHEIWFSPVSMQNFTVPKTTLSRHMANVVLKQAGLKKNF